MIPCHIDLEKYIAGTDWETAVIPLRVFADEGLDLKNLEKLTVVFEWEKMEGALYVDDIKFIPFDYKEEGEVR